MGTVTSPEVTSPERASPEPGVVSRRGVWGRPQLVQGRTLVGGPGGISPPETLGILGITNIYLNDNFEPTTPFLSDQKNLTLSLNFVG